MSKPDIELPVEIHGVLSLDGPYGRQFHFHAAGSRLHLAAAGWTELGQLGPRSLITRIRTLKTTVLALERSGLTFEIDVAGRTTFRFGAGVRPTVIARVLGLRSADFPFLTLFRFLSAAAATPFTHR